VANQGNRCHSPTGPENGSQGMRTPQSGFAGIAVFAGIMWCKGVVILAQSVAGACKIVEVKADKISHLRTNNVMPMSQGAFVNGSKM